MPFSPTSGARSAGVPSNASSELCQRFRHVQTSICLGCSADNRRRGAAYSEGSLDKASVYVAVMVTSIEGIVAVVVRSNGFARI